MSKSGEGFIIPAIDQLGKDRSATPAIGSVEYYSTFSLDRTKAESKIQLMTEGRLLMFKGLGAESEMVVYDLRGALLYRSSVTDGSIVNLENLQSNFVIIRVQDQAFKVLLK